MATTAREATSGSGSPPFTKIDPRGPAGRPATDWDAYYARPYRTATLARTITGRRLIGAMRRHVVPDPIIVELGGANSCFFDLIRERIRPSEYHIVDTNEAGLQRFRERYGNLPNVHLHRRNVLSLELPVDADLVFSVGLIEHFDVPGTREAIRAHFRIVKPHGMVLITFPTPTWLYRLTRSLSEACGAWIFHDERPLCLEEVGRAAAGCGTLLEKRIVWPIFLTQYHVLWKSGRNRVLKKQPHKPADRVPHRGEMGLAARLEEN